MTIQKNNNPQVHLISAAQTIDLRSRILRPGQPIENCRYIGDDDDLTFHLGVIMNARILSNGTFMNEKHKKFSAAKNPYRLRGMAVDQAFQNQGFGKLIVETALAELTKRNCDLLWFNARVLAEGFYQKMGFTALAEIFDIPMAGPHKVMYKWFR